MNILNTEVRPGNTPGKTFFWVISACLILVIVITLVIVFRVRKAGVEARRQAELGQNAATVNVVTYTLGPRVIRDRINLPGTIQPWVRLDVVSQVAGEVLEKKAVQQGIMEILREVNKRLPLKASYLCSLITRADIVIVGTFMVAWAVKAAEQHGLTSGEATAKGAIPMIVMGVFSMVVMPVVGILIDRWGRIPTILLCLFSGGASGGTGCPGDVRPNPGT